jgi:hypothetical protein
VLLGALAKQPHQRHARLSRNRPRGISRSNSSALSSMAATTALSAAERAALCGVVPRWPPSS